MNKMETGIISWFDLTVPDAEKIKDFYAKVIGWEPEPVPMGNYNDYNMNNADGSTVAGICNKRGSNKNLPSHWMIYINVEDLDESMKNCGELGGRIIDGPKVMKGYGKYCIIEDPAGAVCALFESEM